MSPEATTTVRAPSRRTEARRYLQPGELFVSREPVELVTILGSCVAVCVWCPDAGVGGMNHFLLPGGARGGADSLRHGAAAVQSLVREVGATGTAGAPLEAKVFGGAAVLGSSGAVRLGARNVETAMHQLERLGVEVVARDTGGRFGRKVRFLTGDGTALVRQLGANP